MNHTDAALSLYEIVTYKGVSYRTSQALHAEYIQSEVFTGTHAKHGNFIYMLRCSEPYEALEQAGEALELRWIPLGQRTPENFADLELLRPLFAGVNYGTLYLFTLAGYVILRKYLKNGPLPARRIPTPIRSRTGRRYQKSSAVPTTNTLEDGTVVPGVEVSREMRPPLAIYDITSHEDAKKWSEEQLATLYHTTERPCIVEVTDFNETPMVLGSLREQLSTIRETRAMLIELGCETTDDREMFAAMIRDTLRHVRDLLP